MSEASSYYLILECGLVNLGRVKNQSDNQNRQVKEKTQTDHTNRQPHQSRLQEKSITQANHTNQAADIPKGTWISVSSIQS